MTGGGDLWATYGRRAGQALEDFCDFAELASGLVDQGRSAYDRDIYLRLAAEAIVHRMGEAIGRLPPELIERHPSIRFSLAKGMRNRIAYQYQSVDYEILWQAMAVDLPQMAVQVAELLGGRARRWPTAGRAES